MVQWWESTVILADGLFVSVVAVQGLVSGFRARQKIGTEILLGTIGVLFILGGVGSLFR